MSFAVTSVVTFFSSQSAVQFANNCANDCTSLKLVKNFFIGRLNDSTCDNRILLKYSEMQWNAIAKCNNQMQ